jgi:hypothetical protein
MVKTKYFYDTFKSFDYLETFSEYAGTGIDDPWFWLMPTTFDDRSLWANLTSDYKNINLEIREKLLNSGFILLDREILTQKTRVVDILENLSSENQRFFLLDKDYGIVLYERDSRIKCFNLNHFDLRRYLGEYPHFRNNPSFIYEFGMHRGQSIWYDGIGKMNYNEGIIEFDIFSRVDLDLVINNISSKISNLGSRFQMWYRGQTKEYFLPNLTKEANDGFCPYRDVIDVSMPPSLYRNFVNSTENIQDYLARLGEIKSYETGLKLFLDKSDFTIRKSIDETPKQFFNQKLWLETESEMSTVWHDKNGNVKEVHDYHKNFRALQTSLFLQHYGIDTTILDITKDVDIALFFAQHKLVEDKYVPLKEDEECIIYIFLLDPDVDRFLDSTVLLEEFGIERPMRQKCGILSGATVSFQNCYSRFISYKLKIKKRIEYNDEYKDDFLFPPEDKDDILHFLLDWKRTNNLKQVSPFGL